MDVLGGNDEPVFLTYIFGHHPVNQNRHPVPDETADLGQAERFATFVGQSPCDGGVNIRRAVDQRAVKVKYDRGHGVGLFGARGDGHCALVSDTCNLGNLIALDGGSLPIRDFGEVIMPSADYCLGLLSAIELWQPKAAP